MMFTIELTGKQVQDAWREFANERTGAHICEGCSCIGCEVMRKVRDAIKNTKKR